MKTGTYKLSKFINEHDKLFEIIYMIILALYPMMRVNQGLSVMDTTYSLSNFAAFKTMSGTWMTATYLSNFLGNLFMQLPGGSTMLGMNIYTSLIVSITAVSVFIFLKRDLPSHVLFIGELIALSLCWCPTTLLYNYLTYLLFALGTLVLYRGVCGGRDDCYVAAGILLGVNVSARFPNITEAAMILVVWYVAIIEHKKIGRVLKETFMCIGGYLLGMIIPIVIISIRYEQDAYVNMISNLFAMTDKAVDYKPLSMITAMFGDYGYAAGWIVIFVAAGLLCASMYAICTMAGRKKNPHRRVICVVLSLLFLLAAVRVCYSRGMFTFNYYEYRSMYFWAVLMLLSATIVSLVFIFMRENLDTVPVSGPELVLHRKRILGMISLITIYITCLGSNNALYPAVNNMFIVAPFLLWAVYDLVLKGSKATDHHNYFMHSLKYGAAVTIMVIILATLIQGIGFHAGFALQDGDDGTQRDAQVTGYSQVAGIYTTQSNADNLQGLLDYMSSDADSDSRVILYGDDPGLGFILGRESALSTYWPDLDSYTYSEWTTDIGSVEKMILAGESSPYVITSIAVAAWEGQDPDAIEYFGIDRNEFEADQKLNDLCDMMHRLGYRQLYCNDGFAVYGIE